MKTKVIYLLISDGIDSYFQQLLISLYSLRLHNPSTVVNISVDQDTFTFLLGYMHILRPYNVEIVTIHCPKEYNKTFRSRFIKTSLRKFVSGDFLFIDTDTVITGDLSPIDNIDVDLGAVIDKHLPIKFHQMNDSIRQWAEKVNWKWNETDNYYNSGVIKVKDTPETLEFYRNWNKEWIQGTQNGVWLDQPTFNKVHQEGLTKISDLNGIWNCQINENGIKYLMDAIIIHYFASSIKGELDNESPYIFRQKWVLDLIKSNRYIIPEKIKENIKNAKKAFNDKVELISGRNVDIRYSLSYEKLSSIYLLRPHKLKILEQIYIRLTTIKNNIKKYFPFNR